MPYEPYRQSRHRTRTHDAFGSQTAPFKAGRADFRLSDEQYALAKRRLFIASTLQYALPGVPCVFYGDECGVQGFEDPLNRATYPWGREDNEIVEHYKKLGALRKDYAELLQGNTHFVFDENKLIFERESEEGVLLRGKRRQNHNSHRKRKRNLCRPITAISLA